MEWLELKIDTSPSGLDAVTALLEQQGITGVIIDDEADFKDFLEHNRQYWDYVDEDLLREKAGVSRVTFYLERNEDALNIVAQVRIAMSALRTGKTTGRSSTSPWRSGSGCWWYPSGRRPGPEGG